MASTTGATKANCLIRQLKFASIPVSDQGRALSFYTEKLGFQVATDQPMGEGKRWIELRIPGAETRVVLFTSEGQEDRIGTFTGLSFQTDDIESAHKLYSSRGVEFLGPPRHEPWGSYAMMRDPDGNTFVLGTKS